MGIDMIWEYTSVILLLYCPIIVRRFHVIDGFMIAATSLRNCIIPHFKLIIQENFTRFSEYTSIIVNFMFHKSIYLV